MTEHKLQNLVLWTNYVMKFPQSWCLAASDIRVIVQKIEGWQTEIQIQQWHQPQWQLTNNDCIVSLWHCGPWNKLRNAEKTNHTSALNKFWNDTGEWGILSTIEMYLILLSSGNVNQRMEHLKRNQSTRSIPIVADDVHSSKHMHLLS